MKYFTIILLIKSNNNFDSPEAVLNLETNLHRNDRWSHIRRFFSNENLSDELSRLLDEIEPKSYFLNTLISDGANIELYMQLPGVINHGTNIDLSILNRLVKMNIQLGFEVFPDWILDTD